MSNRFYFHEGCRNDVKAIVDDLNALPDKPRSGLFLSRLVEAYQNIYENPGAGERLYEDAYPPAGGIEKKCVVVPGFPYLVVYIRPASAALIVVGVVYSAKAMTHY